MLWLFKYRHLDASQSSSSIALLNVVLFLAMALKADVNDKVFLDSVSEVR